MRHLFSRLQLNVLPSAFMLDLTEALAPNLPNLRERHLLSMRPIHQSSHAMYDGEGKGQHLRGHGECFMHENYQI
ncbi:hypothetical protein GGR50DRAFT_104609 [Xylaria sp. CBS 124048]|nr:hypothetical protein GGR50DRAFT_104609 [Xylaria sp. CBS 124048]